MPYKLIFMRSFTKQFDKLPKTAKEQVLKGLEKAASDPYAGTKLQGKLAGLWRWRMGKYRAIYTIDEKESNLVFVDVGLRKSIYE
ncbi:MAG: type II toxin-antitoxin system RelE/ParE family toxin [Candidatus Bathyarchaeia archaeon]